MGRKFLRQSLVRHALPAPWEEQGKVGWGTWRGKQSQDAISLAELSVLALTALPKGRCHTQLQRWQDNAAVSQAVCPGPGQPWLGASPL